MIAFKTMFHKFLDNSRKRIGECQEQNTRCFSQEFDARRRKKRQVIIIDSELAARPTDRSNWSGNNLLGKRLIKAAIFLIKSRRKNVHCLYPKWRSIRWSPNHLTCEYRFVPIKKIICPHSSLLTIFCYPYMRSKKFNMKVTYNGTSKNLHINNS